MNLDRYQCMDPHLLVGLVNTGMRNEDEDLAGLCARYDLDQETLLRKLEAAGYTYLAEHRRFS